MSAGGKMEATPKTQTVKKYAAVFQTACGCKKVSYFSFPIKKILYLPIIRPIKLEETYPVDHITPSNRCFYLVKQLFKNVFLYKEKID